MFNICKIIIPSGFKNYLNLNSVKFLNILRIDLMICFVYKIKINFKYKLQKNTEDNVIDRKAKLN